MNKKQLNLSIHSLEIQNGDSKESVIKKVTGSLFDQEMIADSALFYKVVMERERIGNTHIGFGAALIHLINESVKQEGIYLYYLSSPLQHWHADDTSLIKLVIVYAINNTNSHNLVYFRGFSSLCADDTYLKQLVDHNVSIETIEKFILNRK